MLPYAPTKRIIIIIIIIRHDVFSSPGWSLRRVASSAPSFAHARVAAKYRLARVLPAAYVTGVHLALALKSYIGTLTCATEVCRETSRCHAKAHFFFFVVAVLAVRPYERHLANASVGRHTRSCSRVRATDYALRKRTLHVDMRIPIYSYLRGLHFTG